MAAAAAAAAIASININEGVKMDYDAAQGDDVKELRIATLGNVDAGKTTLTSVLINGVPDNGRGSARLGIMKYKHEQESGRTSTITDHYFRVQDPLKKDRTFVGVFRDLAGHGSYFKTTVRGMCRPLHYAMLTIAANDGVMDMTREHFTLALNLRIPLFIVITKIDMAQAGSVEATRRQIIKILTPHSKASKANKRGAIKQKTQPREAIFMCESPGDYDNKLEMVKKTHSDGDFHRYIPVFEVSNKANLNVQSHDICDVDDDSVGASKTTPTIDQCQGIRQLFDYIIRLPVYQNYQHLLPKPAAYFVEHDFQVKGVGLVLSGIVMSGEIKKGDKLRLGPFYDKFHTITVRSIHNNFREEVPSLSAGYSGCLAIRVDNSANVTRKMIKSGMRVVSPGAEECLYWRFRAKILIQQHPSSIEEGYSTVVHCGAINQACIIETIITEKENKVLRLGDRAEVVFKFIKKPEYIQPGMRLVFRECRTKGVGEVVCIMEGKYVNNVLRGEEAVSAATSATSAT